MVTITSYIEQPFAVVFKIFFLNNFLKIKKKKKLNKYQPGVLNVNQRSIIWIFKLTK